MARSENLLIVADSDHDATMLYAVGMFVPDAFIFLQTGNRRYVVLSDLEIDRARREVKHCEVLPLSHYQKLIRGKGQKNPRFEEVIAYLLREKGATRVSVPANFPLGLATHLHKEGIRLKPRPGGFFPQREQKSSSEVRKISAALLMAEVGMAEAMHVLRATKIARDRRLMYHGVPLTSEKLRSVIDTAILQAGGLASHTIVAGGKQGCDPHERGFGPLRGNEPIILDIFPRSQATGYFGDITRTVVRGRASEEVRKMYDTVWQGQELAFRQMKAGASTSGIHKSVQDYFVAQGYRTGQGETGRMEGFFHGTGHGLGLEIHEAPRVGATSAGNLVAGQVVTVEPGLYYSEFGGIRLEDVALITKTRPRNLTRFEKCLEL
jgi:Xaa-Pro aminopeptidase